MTKFKSVLALALIAFVAVGCGKDKKKSNDAFYNPYLGFNGQMIGSQAYTGLQQWAAGTEVINYGLPAIQVTKSVSSFTSGCSEKNLFLGLKVYVCDFGSSGSGTNVQSIVQIPGAMVRSQYPAMQAILSPVAPLFLVNVVQTGYNTYEVTHAESATNKTIKYVIDTNLHAALQPRVKEDSINKSREIVVYPN